MVPPGFVRKDAEDHVEEIYGLVFCKDYRNALEEANRLDTIPVDQVDSDFIRDYLRWSLEPLQKLTTLSDDAKALQKLLGKIMLKMVDEGNGEEDGQDRALASKAMGTSTEGGENRQRGIFDTGTEAFSDLKPFDESHDLSMGQTSAELILPPYSF